MTKCFLIIKTLRILMTGSILLAAILLYAPCLYAQGAAFIPLQEKDPYFFLLTSGGKTYPGQWHLWNQMPVSGVNAGLDAGLENAWNVGSGLGYTGRGVVIGIVDDGVEGTHEDLKDNYRPDLSKNFSQDAARAAKDQGPVQPGDNHGTAVGGVAAARGGNSIGGTGAAPFVGIAGLRIRLGKGCPGDPVGGLQDTYDAYLWKSGLNSATLATDAAPEIHIKNHSYGPDEPFDIGEGSERIKNILKATSENAVIHVFSAGNARNKDTDKKEASCEDANKDFSLTSPYVMTVAALGSDGTYASYSSYGANVFVTAPSSSYANYYGITTTDQTGDDYGYNKYDAVKNPNGDDREAFPNTNYTSTFGGTSSSAPLVSGIMALGKEANPLMSIRMAKHALSLPSVTTKNDAADSEWILNKATVQRNFNPNYGFGLIQADKFVDKIEEVAFVTTEKTLDIDVTDVNKAIPDDNPAGQAVTFNINPVLPVESVEVGLKFSHQRRGDLRAYLISPDGTESRLFNDTSVTLSNENIQDNAAVTDFEWTFLTNSFWGEQKNGDWTLKMVDVAPDNTGTWLEYGVLFHLGKMELQQDGPVDFGAADIEAESLTMTQYDDAAYKINNGYSFTVRDGLTLRKGTLEVNGTFDLQGVYDSIIDGKLTGAATGVFYKSGTGMLTINGDASGFSGTTDIGAGRVKMGAGGVLSGNIEIRSGAVLSGIGTVGTIFANRGMVEPGNSIGILTVAGNYTQSASGGLTIEVASTTATDVLSVGGVADLDGLLKTVWLGSSVPKPNIRFASFLTAAKVIGEFSSLSTSISPTLKFTPRYTADDKEVYLVTERDYENSSLQSSLNANQRAVSAMLGSLANGAAGDLDTVFSTIDALSTNDQVAAAFDSLIPISGAAHATMSTRAAVFQAGNAAGRLEELRSGVQGFSFSGLDLIDREFYHHHGRRPILLAANGDDLRGMITREADPRWGVFAKGSLILGDQKNTPGQKGYDFRNSGFTLGMDYRIAPRAVAGAMFGYNDSLSSVNDTGSKVAMEGFAASLYGSVFGDALYGDAQLSYGLNRYDNTRRIVFPGLDRTAVSSPSGNQISAYGGTGYDFRKGSWTLGPTLSLQYIRLQVGDYTETGAGALNLHVDQNTVESLLGSAGGRISWRWEGDGIRVLPRLWAAWRHEFAATDQTALASLAQTGSAFAVSVPGLESNYIAAGAGISMQWKDFAVFFLNYDVQLGQKDFWAHGVNAGVRLAF